MYEINKCQIPSYFDEILLEEAQADISPSNYITETDILRFGKSLFPDEQIITSFTGNVWKYRKLHLNKFIYNTRLVYNNFRSSECIIQNFIVLINEQPYGSIILYKDKEDSQVARIQWIFRFPIPTMFGIINPSLQKRLPKLNEILIPSVMSEASKQGIKKLYVNPIGAQLDILQNTYGFVPTSEDMIKPCNLTVPKDRINLIKYL